MHRLLSLFIVLGAVASFGCSSSEDTAIDKPLMQNAPPPPARPNKPSVSVSGAGGGAAPQSSTTAP